MTSEKITKLESLSEVIKDSFENYSTGCRIGSPHYILYAGNIDSKIMVVQTHPDNAELNWAMRHDTHKDYVCTGPGGHTFKSAAAKAGFNPDKDFVYVNIIPFYPMAGTMYPPAVVDKMLWIFQSLLEILQPKAIISLGYDAFNIIVGGEDKIVFEQIIGKVQPHSTHNYLTLEDVENTEYRHIGSAEEALKKNCLMLSLGDYLLVPLEDPEKVRGEWSGRNKAFYYALKIFYTIRHKFKAGANNDRK